MIFAGGDWRTEQLNNGNGVGSEVWALKVSTGVWRQLHPFCPPAGAMAPARPDNVVWIPDPTRNRAIMAPGYYFGVLLAEQECPGPQYVHDSIAFNFGTGKWGPSNIPEPFDGWGGDNHGLFGVYDPTTDQLIRPRWSGGWGFQIEKFSFTTGMWTYWFVYSETLPVRDFYTVYRTQPAHDAQNGILYMADRNRRVLYVLNYRAETVSEVPMPPQWPAEEPTGGIEAATSVFDSVNRRALILGRTEHGTSDLAGIAIYDPLTGTMTWEPAPLGITGSVAGFDVASGQMVLIGKRATPSAYYLYRGAAR
jgi:hypothetical protein